MPGLAGDEHEPARARARRAPGSRSTSSSRRAADERAAARAAQRRGSGTPARVRGRRPAAGASPRRSSRWCSACSSARGRGAQLVAQQHPQLVVDAQRLGDVAGCRERLHQERGSRVSRYGAARDQLPPARSAAPSSASPSASATRARSSSASSGAPRPRAARLESVAFDARAGTRAEQAYRRSPAPGRCPRLRPAPRRVPTRPSGSASSTSTTPARAARSRIRSRPSIVGRRHGPPQARQDRPQGGLRVARRALAATAARSARRGRPARPPCASR